MPAYARFGPPIDEFASGGAHLTVHVVPVFGGRLVVFDVTAPEARGRWLPWDLLPFAGNPYQVAAELADEWCGPAISELRPIDVLSLLAPGESWELAIVFRCELDAMPSGDDVRRPVAVDPAATEVANRFPALELERWVTAGLGATDEAPAEDDEGERLVF